VSTSPRRRTPKLNLDVDERTEEMSDRALHCRKLRHNWVERSMTRKRYYELIQQGIMEDLMTCDNGCGSTWDITWSLRNGEVLESKRQYPSGTEYLMPKGQGRLSRDAARIAYFARKNATLR
jgi:hypothetical protein